VIPRQALSWVYRRIEWLLGLLVLGGLLYMAVLTYTLEYFPQPFFYDADDTFRDWFSTSIWAHEYGAYDTWLTVYPPLSFLLLKIFGAPQCYVYAPLSTVRDCDWIGLAAIHLFYVLNIVVAAKTFMKVDRATALPRSFALTAGMPMLFGLERGNLILVCFICIMLGWGPLVRSARLRWIFVGLAVNFKVYLIAGVATQLIRRRWLWVEGATIAIILVYVVSYALYQQGNPKEIFENLVNFSEGFLSTPSAVMDVWYPNTYKPLYYILTKAEIPITSMIGSDLVEFLSVAVIVVVSGTQAIIVFAAGAAWLRPEIISPSRLAFLGLSFAMITSETSAYTQPVLFFFIFMEPWKGICRPIAIIVTYILCIPGDILVGNPIPVLQFSYIGNHYVTSLQGISVGMLLRPLGLLVLGAVLSIQTIAAVWGDILRQGWHGRWRFRRDAPLLPWIAPPRDPRAAKDVS
jgi:hypothetical protein